MMFKTTKIYTTLIAAALMIFIACQSTETTESIYPANEIPVSTNSKEALQEFVNGLEIFDLGDERDARAYFEKALELDPDFVSAQMYRAFSSNSAKDFAENRDKLLAMKEKANDGEKLMLEMIQANMNDDELAGLEAAKKLAELYPKSARAQDNLAGYYAGLDDTGNERQHLGKALELNPEFLPAIRNLGFSYLFETPKDFAKAEQYMTQVLEKIPENARAQIDLGDCYRAQNDIAKALASYTKAAELDPDDEVALSKAGHANSFLGNFDAARKNYQDARSKSEFGTGSYNFEAFTYLYEGDYQKALGFLEEAINNIEAMDIPASNKNGAKMGCTFDRAMIAFHQGDVDYLKKVVGSMKPLSNQIAVDLGTEAAKLNQQANMHSWDALTSVLEGNFDEAAAKAELIKSSLETIKDPQKLRPYHRVHAYINYQQGNYEKALEHMKELSENNLYDKYWMAKANEKAGNTEKAMEMFKEIAGDNFNSVGYALVRNELKEMLSSS